MIAACSWLSAATRVKLRQLGKVRESPRMRDVQEIDTGSAFAGGGVLRRVRVLEDKFGHAVEVTTGDGETLRVFEELTAEEAGVVMDALNAQFQVDC